MPTIVSKLAWFVIAMACFLALDIAIAAHHEIAGQSRGLATLVMSTVIGFLGWCFIAASQKFW